MKKVTEETDKPYLTCKHILTFLPDRMHYLTVFTLLVAYAWADDSHYSFSPSVGSGSGTSFSITGEERITAIRLWERYGNYINGIQIRYGSFWSQIAGYTYSSPIDFELYEDEKIIQVSGKYAHYIQSLLFVTNKSRSMFAGQPSGHSFNMYPTHQDAEMVGWIHLTMHTVEVVNTVISI